MDDAREQAAQGPSVVSKRFKSVGEVPPWAPQQLVEPCEQAAFGTSVVTAFGRRHSSPGIICWMMPVNKPPMGRLLLPKCYRSVGGIPPWALQQLLSPVNRPPSGRLLFPPLLMKAGEVSPWAHNNSLSPVNRPPSGRLLLPTLNFGRLGSLGVRNNSLNSVCGPCPVSRYCLVHCQPQPQVARCCPVTNVPTAHLLLPQAVG